MPNGIDIVSEHIVTIKLFVTQIDDKWSDSPFLWSRRSLAGTQLDIFPPTQCKVSPTFLGKH